MKKIIKVVSDKPKDFTRIEFMISNVCNFKCWYCGPHANGGDYRWHGDTDLLIRHFSHLLDFYIINGRKKFELNLLGGEPTLWPDLIKFVTALKDKYDIQITMTTNGSRSLRYWEENCKSFDKLYFSYHIGYTDINQYIDTLDLVFSKGISAHALIMMDPKNWDQCVEVIETCKIKSKERWLITAMEVYSEIPYNSEQKKYFNRHYKRSPSLWRLIKDEIINSPSVLRLPKVVFDNGRKKSIEKNWISLNNLNHFKGWYCSIGIENVNIHKDGSITGVCMEKPFSENEYYNIYDKDFISKFRPAFISTVCTKESCYCQPEILMTKSVEKF